MKTNLETDGLKYQQFCTQDFCCFFLDLYEWNKCTKKDGGQNRRSTKLVIRKAFTVCFFYKHGIIFNLFQVSTY